MEDVGLVISQVVRRVVMLVLRVARGFIAVGAEWCILEMQIVFITNSTHIDISFLFSGLDNVDT